MNNGFVNQELKNNILEITFGHPKSNSLPGEILEKLAATILESGKNDDVKAILLKSAGEKAFCAGASFDELLSILYSNNFNHRFPVSRKHKSSTDMLFS